MERSIRNRWMAAALAAGLALLAGCAGPRTVDSEVRSFAVLGPLQVPASYRFERLPSQQSYGDGQAQLETLAQQVLQKKGLSPADAAQPPRYAVQIGLRTQRESRSAWENGFTPPLAMNRDFIVSSSGQVLMMTPMVRPDMPWYQREVSVVIREQASGQVVYESRANHVGRWADGPALLAALFEAALDGFPHPPAGVRRVQVEVAP